MNFDIVFVLLALIGMIAALVWDKMRPGMVLLTVVVFFLCVGILTPKEMLEGFSNKGMITAGGGYFRPDHQAMGGGGEASGHEILDPSLVCHDIGRYMYLDRYFYESGGARHDSGGGI